MPLNRKSASRTGVAAALAAVLLAMQFASAGAASDNAVEAAASAGPAGFLKKAAFITTPMWLSAILLVTSDIRPQPLPEVPGGSGEPLGPNSPSGNVSSQINWLEAELQRARAKAEASDRHVKALEAALGHSSQPVLAWLDLIPAQGMLAGIAGAMGLLAIAGPSTFVRCYLATVGSAVAGLMVGACASYCSGFSGSPFWIDGVRSILSGQGSIVEYLLWLILFVLGFLRWLTGWECGLYAVVDEVEMGEGGVVTVLHKPLLAGQSAGAALPPPPGPPPTARDAV